MTRGFGVQSEMGKLRTVMVCTPGRAHERLTPRGGARRTARRRND